jgi:hypothetical protein
MKVSTSIQSALCASIAASLLAACGGSEAPIGAPGAIPHTSALAVQADSRNYKVVYSFSGGSDGEAPNGVTDVGGTLYGTTKIGGVSLRLWNGL